MREALLILRKDVDHRRWMLAAFLLLILVRMAIDILLPHHTGLLTAQNILGIVFLMAAIGLMYDTVQQERIVGDLQYWLTRPFPRGSIVAAKGLFIGLFILLPSLLAGSVAVAVNGIVPSLAPPLPLFLALAGTFVLSVASITRSTVQFVLTAVAYVVLSVLSGVLLDHLFGVESSLGSAQAARGVADLAVFLAAAAAALFLQYQRRATALSRSVLIVGMLASAIGLPGWHAAFAVLEKLKGPGPGTGVAIGFDAARSAAVSPGGWSNMTVNDVVGVRIPITIAGIPRGAMLLGERVRGVIDAPGGRHWDSGWRLAGGIVSRDEVQYGLHRIKPGVDYWLELEIDRAFYDAARLKDQPVRVTAAAALSTSTAYRIARMGIPSTANRMGPGELCSAAIPNNINLVITCLSASEDEPSIYRLTDGTHSVEIGLGLDSSTAGLSAWAAAGTTFGSLDLGEPRFDRMLRPLFTGPTKLEIEWQRQTGYLERSLAIDGIVLGPYEAGRSGPRRSLW